MSASATRFGVRCAYCPDVRLDVELPEQVVTAGMESPYVRGFLTARGWKWGTGERGDLIVCDRQTHPASPPPNPFAPIPTETVSGRPLHAVADEPPADPYVADLRAAVDELQAAYDAIHETYGDDTTRMRTPDGRFIALDALTVLVSTRAALAAAARPAATINVHATGAAGSSQAIGDEIARHLEAYIDSGGRIRGLSRRSGL